MPTYTIRNKETEESFDIFCTYPELQKMLEDDKAKRLQMVGQDYKSADYIFNNNMSEVNKNKNKKYDIPINFKKINEFSINGFIIYELYKKI